MLSNYYREQSISTPQKVRSLAWDGDQLVDWAAGGIRYSLDGSVHKRNVSYSFSFDACIVSASGTYSVIYTSIGTKGVILKNGEILRQINRDFYHAHVYTYPVVFGLTAAGQEVLIHCPENYCQIEIEDIETGERITASDERKPRDVFHSRLSVSPDGNWLMNTGWIWHPMDVVELYNLPAAFQDPTILDTKVISPPGMWEMSAATFVDDNHLLLASSDQYFGDDDDETENQPGQNQIALWEIGAPEYSATVSLDEPPGTIMPIGERFAISFFRHPKLIDLETGQIKHSWPQIDSGKQLSSITWDKLPPSIAIDAKSHRFAVGNEDILWIVELDLEKFSETTT